MTVNYTTNLALGQPVTGTESGTWGDDVNNSVTSYLDIAIAGGLAVSITTTDVTLSLTQGTSSATNIGSTTAQYAILNISGAKTAARNLIVPSSSRHYIINNAAATGGFLLTVKGAATTGVTLVDGEKALIAWNGSDYVKIASSVITNLTGTLPVANGGTGLTSGTSGGVPYYSASGTIASSGALAANALVVGGGAGATPATVTTGTGVVTALGVNTGSAGAFVVNGGALGTPSSGSGSNLTFGTGTLSLAGNLTHLGAFAQSFTATATTAVTLPAGATASTNNLLSSATAVGIVTGTPSSTTYLRGDGTWSTVSGASGGTVTSVAQSFTGGLISVTGSPITSSGTLALTVAGTSGGIPYFSSASTWATSAALTANALVIGGGAGFAPSTTTTGTGVVTALGVNTGTAGAFVVNGGALGTPSSGTLTNATGLPLTTGVTGTLPVANGGTGLTTFTSGGAVYATSTSALTTGTLPVASGGTGVTTSTGSGNNVLSTSPTLVTPVLGTPTSVTLTNATGLPLTTGVTGTLPVANGGTGVTASTGSGSVVLSTSPSLTTPILGTPTSGTLSNCTVDGTNGVGYINVPQNAQTGSYTLVASDAGKHIYHAVAAAAATYTIPANSSVAYAIGTAVTFINMSTNNVTISITTDTLYLGGTGTTGSRTLAQYGVATAVKMTSTTWVITGSGLT